LGDVSILTLSRQALSLKDGSAIFSQPTEKGTTRQNQAGQSAPGGPEQDTTMTLARLGEGGHSPALRLSGDAVSDFDFSHFGGSEHWGRGPNFWCFDYLPQD
jgi:hypothetical protein